MFKKGDYITNKKQHLKTIHEVVDYDSSTGVIKTVIRFGPSAGSRRVLTRPENYKKVEE